MIWPKWECLFLFISILRNFAVMKGGPLPARQNSFTDRFPVPEFFLIAGSGILPPGPAAEPGIGLQLPASEDRLVLIRCHPGQLGV